MKLEEKRFFMIDYSSFTKEFHKNILKGIKIFVSNTLIEKSIDKFYLKHRHKLSFLNTLNITHMFDYFFTTEVKPKFKKL